MLGPYNTNSCHLIGNDQLYILKPNIHSNIRRTIRLVLGEIKLIFYGKLRSTLMNDIIITDISSVVVTLTI